MYDFCCFRASIILPRLLRLLSARITETNLLSPIKEMDYSSLPHVARPFFPPHIPTVLTKIVASSRCVGISHRLPVILARFLDPSRFANDAVDPLSPLSLYTSTCTPADPGSLPEPSPSHWCPHWIIKKAFLFLRFLPGASEVAVPFFFLASVSLFRSVVIDLSP